MGAALVDGKFEQSNGWTFNNLAYLSSPKSLWVGNPLDSTNTWKADNGTTWRTGVQHGTDSPQRLPLLHVGERHCDDHGGKGHHLLLDVGLALQQHRPVQLSHVWRLN